jgi:hypothetical protein
VATYVTLHYKALPYIPELAALAEPCYYPAPQWRGTKERLGGSLGLPNESLGVARGDGPATGTMDGGGAMQNSAVMTLRAAVLLACFIAVPLFAVFGKDTPAVLREFIQSVIDRATKASSSSTTHTTSSPMFRPATTAEGKGSAPPSGGAPALQSNPGPPSGSGAATKTAAPKEGAPALPQGTTLLPPVTQGSAPTGVQQASGAAAATAQPAAKKSVYEQATPGQAPASPAGGSTLSAVNFSAEYFKEAESKLRRLGATYYLLESLTPAGDNYRFFCKVAGTQPEAVMAFVATDSDPLKAMHSVVRQIETWRSQAQ